MPSKRKAADDVESFQDMGAAIAAFREKRGVTRSELAANAGFHFETVGRIERGEGGARWGTLRRLAYALDIELSALIKRAEELALVRGDQKGPQVHRSAKRRQGS